MNKEIQVVLGVAVLAGLSLGCSGTQYQSQQGPALVTPHSFAEGHTGKAPLAEDPAHQAAEARRKEQAPDLTFAPDPSAIVGQEHVRFAFRYQGNKLTIERAEHVHTERPVASVRSMGRFALELWIGKELIERVRFDFPLLGAPIPEPVNDGDINRPSLDPGADVQRVVQVVDSERATRAVLVDRATGDFWELSWPLASENGSAPYAPVRRRDGRPPNALLAEPSSEASSPSAPSSGS